MYIENRPASAIFKLLIGVLSLVGFWITVATLGSSAFRLLSTWVLIISGAYFTIVALILALSKKRNAGDIPCPTLEGIILISFLLCGVTAVYVIMSGKHFPGLKDWPMALIYATLPLLVLFDWAFFNRKGRWHYADPAYWLALPAFYAGFIVFTAEWATDSLPLRYPLFFFDHAEIGIYQFLNWLVIFGVSILVAGYLLFFADFVLSGKFSACIAEFRQRRSAKRSRAADEKHHDYKPYDAPEKYVAVEIKAPRNSTRPRSGGNLDGVRRRKRKSTSASSKNA